MVSLTILGSKDYYLKKVFSKIYLHSQQS